MEMNRYVWAALCVMAGCAATVPSRVPAEGEPLGGNPFPSAVFDTVKAISVYVDEGEEKKDFCGLFSDKFPCPEIRAAGFPLGRTGERQVGALCHAIPKIRAPESGVR